MSLPPTTVAEVGLRQVLVGYGETGRVKDVEYIPNVADIGQCGEDMGPVGRTKISDTTGDGVPDKLFICDQETPLTEAHKNTFTNMSEVVENRFGSFFGTVDGAKCYKDKRTSISPNSNVICTKGTDTPNPISAQLLDSNGDLKPDSVGLFQFQITRSDGLITSFSVVQHSITAQIRDTVDKMFASGLAVEEKQTKKERLEALRKDTEALIKEGNALERKGENEKARVRFADAAANYQEMLVGLLEEPEVNGALKAAAELFEKAGDAENAKSMREALALRLKGK
jgi:hypothetical protein